jgi:N-acetylmuramic acid 6-phosphate etherase
VVIGIAASGTTPYVIGALEECRKRGIITGSISCNPESPVSAAADYPIEVVVGPEFVTGSTRMKSGTAQKLVLNMISTTVMIQLGRVEDNKMVNMQLTNDKLVDRGVKMVMEKLQIQDYEKAKDLLLKYGSVKKTIKNYTP